MPAILLENVDEPPPEETNAVTPQNDETPAIVEEEPTEEVSTNLGVPAEVEDDIELAMPEEVVEPTPEKKPRGRPT